MEEACKQNVVLSVFAKKQSSQTGFPLRYVLALVRLVFFGHTLGFTHYVTEQSGKCISCLYFADAGNSCCATGGKGPPGDHLP